MNKSFTSNPLIRSEDTSFRRMVIIILALVSLLTFAAPLFGLVTTTVNRSILFTSAALTLISLYFAIRGKLLLGQILTPIILFVTFFVTNFLGGGYGIFDPGMVGLVCVVTLSSLLLGNRGTIISGVLVTLTILGVGVLEIAGIYKPAYPGIPTYADVGTAIFIAIANIGLLFIQFRRFSEIATKAIKNETSQIEANQELTNLKNDLELRVQERTAELDAANRYNQRRAAQFEAIAQVSRTITVIQDLDTLITSLANLIGERFGFYHTGIFLLDENRQNAVLRAANSEGGKIMVERGHKLKIGQVGVVGYVAGTGRPRIALNVSEDTAFSANPLLPDTLSEMALPLRSGQEIIGVLDVQSTVANAFTQEDVATFSTLADQISTAIQNARSYQETQHLLAESQKTVSGYLQGFWQGLRSMRPQLGYRISKNKIQPLDRPLDTPQVRQVIEKGTTIAESGKKGSFASLAIPIHLRGQLIGVMDIRVPELHEWHQDMIDIAEAVAERLSIAIETATLLQTTQARAEIERATSEISAKISSSTRFEAILRTAAEELSRVLGGSEVLVQLQPDSSMQKDRKEEI